MRSYYLLLSFFCILALTACGTEEELTPPAFANITASGSFGTLDLLNQPSRDDIAIISGTLDDPAATVEVEVNGSVLATGFALLADGSWTLSFNPFEGTNTVSLTASDTRGNLNKLTLTLVHDGIYPTVSATSPAGGTTVTTPVAAVTVTFSETLAVDPPPADFSIDGLPVQLAYDPTTRVATLTVDPPLGNGDHQLVIGGSGGIIDLAGNKLAARTVTITVAIP